MQVALAAWDCYTRVGAYEGERAIAQAVIYLAVAPKSNAVYTAFKQAKRLAQEGKDYDVPEHLRNAPTSLMKSLATAKNTATPTTNLTPTPQGKTTSPLN